MGRTRQVSDINGPVIGRIVLPATNYHAEVKLEIRRGFLPDGPEVVNIRTQDGLTPTYPGLTKGLARALIIMLQQFVDSKIDENRR